MLVIALYPPAAALEETSFLGLTALGWITFAVLWVIQQILVSRGLEMIRHYEAFAGPIILVTMLSIAIWILWDNDWSIALTPPTPLVGLEMWIEILVAASLWVAIYGTFVLNFSDFTRNVRTRSAMFLGNFIGIPINTLFFAAIVVVLAGGQFQLNGVIIENPADVVATIPNRLLLALACLALIILTIAVNLMANFVAPIYTLNNMFPRVFNFRRAGILSGILGVVILPWNLYNSPVVVGLFLGGVGAILRPIFGVMMADYWLIRKGKVNMPDLFRSESTADYYYGNGFNSRALMALIPAAAVSVALAVSPVMIGLLHDSTPVDEAFARVMGYLAGFSWFVGAALGAILYLIVARDNHYPINEVPGDSIAVASTH